MFSIEKIAQITNGEIMQGDKSLEISSFSKDTRTIKPGDLYLPIKGESFDGHEFISQAFELGAAATLTEDELTGLADEYRDKPIVKVASVIKALQDMATYWREQFDIPVVGVTGSVGKTSTKDMIASILSQKYNVLKTPENYNNFIGLPLTILTLNKNHTAAVIEMGMSELGEISMLSKIAKPTISVITNVGIAHINTVGSRENILKAKLEILDGQKEGSVVVLNDDNDMLSTVNNQNYDLVRFGIISDEVDIRGYNVILNEDSSEFNVLYNGEEIKVEVPVAGKHFVYNALAAVTVCNKLGMDKLSVINGIKEFSLSKMRMDIEQIGDIRVIKDMYNAIYEAVKAAIEVMENMKANRKIAVLADMLGNGEFEEEVHRNIGKFVKEHNIDVLVTIGGLAKYMADEAEATGMNARYIHRCSNNEEAIKVLNDILKPDDLVLLKGSRAMKLEEIYNGIKENMS